jgi:hypothetical protein
MKKLQFLLLTATCFLACKDKFKAISKTELLSTYGSWVINNIAAKPTVGGTTYNDITSNTPTCRLDNIFVFVGPNQYSQNEGATKCVTTAPDIVEQGTWALTDNETKITVTVPGGTSRVYTIELLTENNLTAVYTDPTGIISTDYRVTFIH